MVYLVPPYVFFVDDFAVSNDLQVSEVLSSVPERVWDDDVPSRENPCVR